MGKAGGTGEAGWVICAAEDNSSTMKGYGRVEGSWAGWSVAKKGTG